MSAPIARIGGMGRGVPPGWRVRGASGRRHRRDHRLLRAAPPRWPGI